MPFNPSEHMIKLKGKDYLQVMWRLCWFREEKPSWCIDTQLVSHEGDSAVFCAKILDEEGVDEVLRLWKRKQEGFWLIIWKKQKPKQ